MHGGLLRTCICFLRNILCRADDIQSYLVLKRYYLAHGILTRARNIMCDKKLLTIPGTIDSLLYAQVTLALGTKKYICLFGVFRPTQEF